MHPDPSSSSIAMFLRLTFYLLILSSIAFSQVLPKENKADLSDGRNESANLTLEVELNKREYLPFEPIAATLRLSNNTGHELAMSPPELLQDTRLAVTDPAGHEQKGISLTLSLGKPQYLPGSPRTIQPFQIFEEETILPLDPRIFERTGNYRLQFSFSVVKSVPVKITVKEPSGINKDAFEFLKLHGKDPNFADDFLQRKGGLLEKFVRDFSESVYGNHAVFALGSYLLHTGETEKAKAEFEKITNSEIKLIRKWTKKALTEIEEKLRQKSLD